MGALNILHPFFPLFQGDHEQEAEGDGGAGAELRQLQPAAAEGAAGRAEQLRGALPERKKVSESRLHALQRHNNPVRCLSDHYLSGAGDYIIQ